MNLIASFNNEKITEDEARQFLHRRAVRGVVFDNENKVALLHVKNKGYYGLPGGGVDTDETYEQGIIRECKEEIGCTVEIVKYIGTTLEYRKQNNLLNESWGYIIQVIGDKGLPILIGDEDESEKNSIIIWVSLIEAIRLLESIPKQMQVYHQYIVHRDLTFLRYAREGSKCYTKKY
jgi:8-oxo-dGTP pyrophosphatase MutT (NUDIX family)